ncbi:hypothetical protein M3Y95_01055000 [Aphelenchoides besseyi]|nr:hypothetical protein M3Y95_01055000 [Aphelenchoides besseyi]
MRSLIFLLFLFLLSESRRYDAECPFLTDREYRDRLARGRCPRKPISPTTSSPAAPPKLSRGLLPVDAKKKLLKFIFLNKQRLVNITMKTDSLVQYDVIEGSFVEIGCDTKVTNETQIHWFFNGLPLDSSDFNWRIQTTDSHRRIFLAPVLRRFDVGVFECYVNETSSGAVRLNVETIWGALLEGLKAYGIGAAFSLPIVLIVAIYRVYRPEQPLDDAIFETEATDWSMEFDEMMLNLRKIEKAE